MSLGALGIVTWPPTIPFISGETYNACFFLAVFCFPSCLQGYHTNPRYNFIHYILRFNAEASKTYSQYRFPELRSYSSSLVESVTFWPAVHNTKSATAST
jgi:hypothetical protein